MNQILYLLEKLTFWPLTSLLSYQCFEQVGPAVLDTLTSSKMDVQILRQVWYRDKVSKYLGQIR